MTKRARTSIQRKLTTAIMSTSITVLLLTCAVFIAYGYIMFRRNLAQNMTTRTEIIAANSAAALAFQNEADATEVLSAVGNDPHIIAACLYDKNGRVFAKYPATAAADSFPAASETEMQRFEKSHFVVFAPVVHRGRWLGTVYLKSDLSAMTVRFQFYTGLVLVVLCTSILVAFVLSTRLQKSISKPVLNLANTASEVTEQKDYSLRAEKLSDDELGLLTDSFNGMLAQIQTQDNALRHARDELEQRVQERTAQLSVANTALQAEVAERRQLTEERDKFFTVSLDLLCVADLKGCLKRVSPSWERVLGFTAEELLLKPLIEFVHPEDRAATRAENRKLLEGTDTIYFENRYVCKDGSYRRLAWSCPAPGKGQTIVYAAARDITEHKLAEEKIRRLNEKLERQASQLQVSNKELEAFSYSVSHDLRAPLRGLDGFSQALLEDYGHKLGDEGKDLLLRIRAASQRMDRLIDDLLNLSRMSRAELQREPVDLSTLASEVADELRKRDPARHVELRIAENLKTNGDPQLLRVALENLLGNAWKYTSKQPEATIEFGLDKTDGNSGFFVRDDGVGFDMQYVSKLFAPFQRLHGMTEFPGTGVGLATVQRIINRHGGRVWVQAAPNKGATFYFTLS